jgi:UDP-glucose 4-epimerase
VTATYLVTGGAGFIGSHLVDALLGRGDRVIVLDDLSTGRIHNLAAWEGHRRLRFVHGSILDERVVDSLVRRSTVVVHLAAAVAVERVLAAPLASMVTNVRGSQIVIDASERHEAKILVASTSEVYGRHCSRPHKETDDCVIGSPAVARWSYAAAKVAEEAIALANHRDRGLQAVVVRLFNVAGPRQLADHGMVLARLARRAVAHESPEVYGDGAQTRCFCHVEDVVRGLLMLLAQPDAVGEIVNVGSDHEISMLELAHRVVAAAGGGRAPVLVPYSEAYGGGFEDIRRRVPDIRRMRALTGWTPQRPLGEIITDAVEDARLRHWHRGVRAGEARPVASAAPD